MERKNEASRQISEIHQMMQRSSKFISLSGLSGISAGLAALAGAVVAFAVREEGFSSFGIQSFQSPSLNSGAELSSMELFLAVDGVVVLMVALAASIYFTTRRARKNGLKIWDGTTRRLMTNLFMPLTVGGIFCVALYYHGLAVLVPSSTLVFYGLALLHASKYTLEEVRLLGISEILLGLLSLFLVRYGLFFWAAGFGLLHIIYGAMMYSRYESVTHRSAQTGEGL